MRLLYGGSKTHQLSYYGWLDGLNRGLEQAAHPIVDRDQVITPRYNECLSNTGRDGVKLPPIMHRPKEEDVPRREFERRQARVQRLLQLQHDVRSFGFNLVPDAVWSALPEFVLDLPMFDLDQVRRYVRDDKVRADVMSRIRGEPGAHSRNLDNLSMRISAEYARKKLDLPFDTTLWYQVTDYECQISAVLNRLKPFNDHKSSRLVQLSAAQVAVNAFLRFMIEKGLAPNAITDGEPKKALEA